MKMTEICVRADSDGNQAKHRELFLVSAKHVLKHHAELHTASYESPVKSLQQV
jgi:hypothetical protein